MAERTLNDPLSGSEIKAILLQEIEKRLDGDTTLENDVAYAGFTAKFDIRITFLRSLTRPTEIWGGAELQTTVPGDQTETIAVTDSHTSAESPDVERQDHDLPIPVLMNTPSGMERRSVHIEQGEKRRGRPPKMSKL